MSRKRTPLIVVVSAPSGSGKTTIVSRLLDVMPELKRSVSYTTRLPRPGETDERDYIFVSKDKFREKISGGELLEWEEKFGNYYGTPLDQFSGAVERGEDIILSIDVKGARTVKEKFPESISVFVMPPSTDELASRLKGRDSDEDDEVEIRLREAREEIGCAEEYDYLIVNEKLDEAVNELKEIIESERKSRKNVKR